MNEPQPIGTAPRDGAVILTNCGFCRYLDQERWESEVDHGKWAECDPFGNIYECVENGMWLCEPTLWTPVPEWMLK